MAAPVFAAAGAGASQDNGVGDLSVPFPSGIAAGHLLLAQCVIVGDNGTVSTPAGWTLLHGPDGSPGTNGLAQYIFARAAGGGESGSQTFVTSGDAISAGRIYRFTGWLADGTMANNFEGAALEGPTVSALLTDAGITTTAADRLCVNFIQASNIIIADDFNGESGGDWTVAVAEYNTDGSDTLILQTATLAAAGTINGGSVSITSSTWVNRGFAILPEAAAASGRSFLLTRL